MMVESQGVGRLMIVAPKEFNWEDLLQTLPKDRGKVARDRMLGATREVADEYIEELLAEADALERAKVCGALREHCALARVVALIIAAPRLLDQQAAGGARPATCRASLGVSTMQEDKLSGLVDLSLEPRRELVEAAIRSVSASGGPSGTVPPPPKTMPGLEDPDPMPGFVRRARTEHASGTGTIPSVTASSASASSASSSSASSASSASSSSASYDYGF